MKILLYTDCMSINTQVDEDRRYPAIVQSAFTLYEVKVIFLSGMTTSESVESLNQALEENADIVVYGFGVNDALPRGLKRVTRGALIRWSYNLKMTKQMRLWYRSFFLNPLEHIMQLFGQTKHYLTIEEMIKNIDKCIMSFRNNGAKTVMINIAPVANYRFIHSSKHIKPYNGAIDQYCLNHDIEQIDAFNLFCNIGIREALGKDKFHYSELGHKAVAEKLIEILKNIGA